MTTFDIISVTDKQSDLKLLDNALYFEHQKILAYRLSANSLGMHSVVSSTFISTF